MNACATISPQVNACEILQGGEYYFQKMLHLIEESQQSIHLQMYIFREDATGHLIQDALIHASNRGVKVHLLLDGFGTRLSPAFLDTFITAGIEVRFFSKIFFKIPFRVGRRLHQKLLVVDGQHAILGGINVSDEYRGTDTKLAWLDYGIYVSGSICEQLEQIAGKLLNKDYKRFLKRQTSKIDRTSPDIIRVLENDFWGNTNDISKTYYNTIARAKKSIILFSGYFFPNIRLLKFLEKAIQRGVEVKLVLPQKTDVYLYGTAIKYLYKRLLNKGVEIYEYTPTVMHAKTAIVDDNWCTIGSYNLNDLSEFLSLELNVELFDQSIIQSYKQELLFIINHDCHKVSAITYDKAPLISRGLWHLYYRLLSMILNLGYWLTDKDNHYKVY